MQKIGSHPYLRKNVQEREHFSAIITFSGTQMTRAHWMEDNHCGVWPEELGGHWPLGTGLCGPAEAMLCYKASQDEKLRRAQGNVSCTSAQGQHQERALGKSEKVNLTIKLIYENYIYA